MPSFWQWLCVSRQRYNTHEHAKPRPQHNMAGRTTASHSDVMFEIQPAYSSWHRQANGNEPSNSSGYLNEQERNGDRRSGDNRLHNSQDKKKSGARFNGLKESSERSPHVPANYRQLPADRPGPLSAASTELFWRTNSTEVETGNEKDSVRKRRQVQEIFADTSTVQHPHQTSSHGQSLYRSDASSRTVSSQQSNRRSRKSGILSDEHRKRESMYGYTPRSVNDDAISAALFGSRIDDYNPDPSWNMAMDRFASSPTSGMTSNFGKDRHSRSDNVTTLSRRNLPIDSNVTYTSESNVSPTSRMTSGREPVTVMTNNNGKDVSFFHFQYENKENNMSDLGVATQSMRRGDAHGSQVSPEVVTDLDLEKVFSSDGEVLY